MAGLFLFGPLLGAVTEPLAVLLAPAGESGGSNYLQDTYGDLQSGNFRSCSSKPLAMKTISLKKVVAMIPDGASLMIGGFMAVGTPERVIDEIVRQGKRSLTVIANDTAMPGRGIGKLISAGLISKTIASHIGLNPETQQQMIAGKMAVDLVPQGTLIERIRAGGFGLGGILTPTGVGTIVEEGKRRIEVDGKDLSP